MERTWAGWLLIGLGTVISPLPANERAGAMLVLVYEEAGVEPDVFSAAQVEAAAILAAAGIASEWVRCGTASAPAVCRRAGQPDVLRVRILPTFQSSMWKFDSHALGFALSSPGPQFGTFAGVLYDRVLQAASSRESLRAKVLGCVLAHEIGHLLLEGGDHAASGLMKANWTNKEFIQIEQRTFRLPPAQAKKMLRGLEARRIHMRSSKVAATW